ncbi:MAG: hypothetical protein ACK59Y_05380 [Betaproteobacteria bacterium]
MKFWLALILGFAVVQGTAQAGPWREVWSAQERPSRGDRGPQRQQEGGRPERFERPERPHRLSDEERRELHRDLDKARREIYRPRER